MTLTVASKIAPLLKDGEEHSTQDELIRSCIGKTTRQMDDLLATKLGRSEMPDSVTRTRDRMMLVSGVEEEKSDLARAQIEGDKGLKLLGSDKPGEKFEKKIKLRRGTG